MSSIGIQCCGLEKLLRNPSAVANIHCRHDWAWYKQVGTNYFVRYNTGACSSHTETAGGGS
jgi:hypothetical protein